MGQYLIGKHHIQVTPVVRKEPHVDRLARLVVAIALRLNEQDNVESVLPTDSPSEEAA